MSPVIAFDIAVVAQKLMSSIEDRCVTEKVGWTSSRSGWLLELLTELKMGMANSNKDTKKQSPRRL